MQEILYQLRRLLAEGKLVPFVGAGASIGARVIGDKEGRQLPSGRELAYQFAESYRLDESEVNTYDLLDVASAVDIIEGRWCVEDHLRAIFAAPAEPTLFHRWLASHENVSLILTTNYDCLIEQAFRAAGREFHLIMTPPLEARRDGIVLWWPPLASEPVQRTIRDFDFSELDLPVVYKLHGGVDPALEWHNTVTTEDDYFDIGGRMYEGSLIPLSIASHLSRMAFVFIGYSLRDVHVRFLLHQMQRYTPRRQYVVNRTIGRIDAARFSASRVATLQLSAVDLARALGEYHEPHNPTAPADQKASLSGR